MKKLFILFTIFLLSITGLFYVQAEEISDQKVVNLYFFWGNGCPHCEKEKSFLEKMVQKYPGLKINSFEVWGNSENRDLMIKFGQNLNATVNGVPFTVVGEKYTVGWMDEKNTGKQIEEMIICHIETSCRDVGKELGLDTNIDKPNIDKNLKIPETLTLPIIGEIHTKNISLPVLTIIIGALDGFNPCAMWALIFLISLLLGMNNRKRMWILGSTFIITSGAVYFLFLSAWLNLLLFIGFITIVRIIIAFVALGGGLYYLKQYFFDKTITCVGTKTESRKKFFDKLKQIIHEKKLGIAFFGIILLAIAVNLIELICSAGLPAIYTQILTLNNLPIWQYYGYLLLYILIFMLDDMIVFVMAMVTLKMSGISTKYTHISRLVGGISMTIIGTLLLFKPELLMFG